MLLFAALLVGLPSQYPTAVRPIRQLVHTTWDAQAGAPPGIRVLSQTGDGYLWIGTTFGLVRFDGVRFTPFVPRGNGTLPDRGVKSLLASRDGTLWIVWENGTVSHVVDGRLTSYGEDIATALETIARDRTAATRMEVGVTIKGSARRLPPPVADAALRIGREAIVNAVRHADADQLEIQLDFRTNELKLEVRDDGRGVDEHEAEEARKRGHLGLSSIQSRASLLGGRCEVRPRAGGGTVVALELPLADRDSR